jgi:lipopolysaccharide export system protein LptA
MGDGGAFLFGGEGMRVQWNQRFTGRLAWLTCVVMLAFLVLPAPMPAQQSTAVSLKGGFTIPYYDGNRKTAEFSGREAKPMAGSLIEVTRFQIKTFSDEDEEKVDLIIEAPECVFDRDRKVATSPGPLKVYNANTNYAIEGRGFLWWQTKSNMHLVISNDVHTVLSQQSRPPIAISSQKFQFHSERGESNALRTAIYNEDVRVEDPDMVATGNSLVAQLPQGEKVRRITLQKNVSILNRREGGRGTAAEGIYTVEGTNEIVTLNGDPVWQDKDRRLTADQFILDRNTRVVHAIQNAELIVTNNATGGEAPSFSLGGNETASGVVRMTASLISLTLPGTNRAEQRIEALTNVVILAKEGRSKATCERFNYAASTGLAELFGGARWKDEETELKADTLRLNQKTRDLAATGHSWLRMPLGADAASSSSGTNQIMEVASEQLNYSTNRALFQGNVDAHMFAEGRKRLDLSSRILDVSMASSNEVTAIRAEDKVLLKQYPQPAETNWLSQTVRSEVLSLRRDPATRLWRDFAGTGNVEVERVARGKSGKETPQKLRAKSVDGTFSSTTNAVEKLFARGDVYFEQEGTWATGQQAVYPGNGPEPVVVLTGNPKARVKRLQKDGTVEEALIEEAEVFEWNPASGKFKARPFRIVPLKQPTAVPSEAKTQSP